MGRTGTGVEIRETSIRLSFTLAGVTYKELLRLNGKALPPTAANVKFAHRHAAEVKRAIAAGVFEWEVYFPESKHAARVAAARPTLGGLLDALLESKGRLSPSTRDQYATAARFWKGLLGADTPLEDVDHKFLAAKIGGFDWPSPKTHNNYLIVLRGALELEYRGAKALANPLAGISNMKVVRKLPDPLSLEERERILADMRKHYPAAIVAYFMFAFATGMRPEEIIALRWSDIDTERQLARVQRVRTFRGSEREGSKTHTVRDVDLVPMALEALAVMAPVTKMKRTEREDDDDTAADIFQNPVTGRPWHDERSQRDHYWRPALKRLGIRWRRPYCTRHTFATAALMGEVPPAYIAAQLGHSVKMLLEVYARWLPQNDNGRARAKLAAAQGANSSQILPTEGGPRNEEAPSTEVDRAHQIGRRDWTRTNTRGN
jgi:integrase